MTDCEICCERFNLQNHKKITCSFCDFKTCRKCVQTYLVGTVNDPHCMKCKQGWNREFIDESCTKTFRNKELKIHRENILFEREKSFLPETQDAAMREKQKRNINKLIGDAREEIGRQKELIYTLEQNLNTLNAGHNIDEGGTQKKQFVRKCPVEDCKGFLTSNWKCDMCENKICSKCNEIKNDEHECDEKNVETVNLLKKDTKPCPKCGTLIFRTGGCAQMWCTSCHCAFNWNTGRIEEGMIHNPHFYEFQRRNATVNANRAIGDIPCGGLPNLTELNTFFNKKPPQRVYRGYYRQYTDNVPRSDELSETQTLIYNVHRLITHIDEYEFRYNLRENALVTDNRDLRIRFLLNEINEEYFKKVVQQREKKNQKTRDLIAILRMFTLTASDMLRQLVLRELNQEEFCTNIVELKEYTNVSLTNIGKRYNCVKRHIGTTWDYD